jgi:Domain of unknown function (DUF4112)
MTLNSDPRTKTLAHLRQLTYLLDNAIPLPGTNYRLGLDPILGLIPGGGDTIGAVLSVYIVIRAALLDLPAALVGKMVLNILVELVAGSIPVLGDIFDVTWRSNVRNMKLLEAHIDAPQLQPSQALDRYLVFGLLAFLILLVVGLAALTFVLVRLLFG